MSRLLTVVAGVAVVCSLTTCAAQARFEPAKLVSASATEQAATGISGGAVSADGRYVVFQTSARNLSSELDTDSTYREGGIYRKDLESGALELVAGGDRFNSSDGVRSFFGASDASISADGRYVAFSTGESLHPSDANACRDVYVRDMAEPIGAPVGAFTLVSAKDGQGVPPNYATCSVNDPGTGSGVSARGAISADGRKVVFVSNVGSDLPKGLAASAAGQVLVRDLDQATTTLVSELRDPQTGRMGGPAGGGSGGTALLSADASTVVWTATNAPQQATFLDGEATQADSLQLLWRRVADGPQAPTRRVITQSDPDDPACPEGGSASSAASPGVCDGPFTGNGAQIVSFAVSADGKRVVASTRSGPRGVPEIPTPQPLSFPADLFLSDMSNGVSRKLGFRELTRPGGVETDQPDTASVGDVAISSDGRWAAISTSRTSFVLPQPSFIGAAAVFNSGVRELYAVDLLANTIELVTRARDGSKSNGSSDGPTVTSGGQRFAFASAASNLFADGTPAGDLFIADRIDESGTAAPESLPVEVESVNITGKRNLPVTIRALRNGRVRVDVLAPGVGTARARATAKRKGRIASSRKRSTDAGQVTLVLKAQRRVNRLMRRRAGLTATIDVTFSPPTGRQLKRTFKARFRLQRGKR